MKNSVKKFSVVLIILLAWIFVVPVHTMAESARKPDSAKKKVQEVNFDGDDVDGVVRRPDGMFLVQKKSIDFVPLYRVRDGFDQNIRDSVEHLR